jgi:hypothetical protein
MAILVILVLAAIVAGILIMREDGPPATNTPIEIIESDLAKVASSLSPTVEVAPATEVVARATAVLTLPEPTPVLELTEQVKPKRVRKPRAATATAAKAPRKPRTKKVAQ